MILSFITYIACVIFITRFAWHVFSWLRADSDPSAVSASNKGSADIYAPTLLDIILFRRLFRTNKLLWAASWTFHISLFFVLIRHLRYFMYPVPGIILSLQSTGLYAGYILPLSLLLLLLIRMRHNRDTYVSAYNLFLIVALFLSGVTGLLLSVFLRTDLVEIKAYMLGIISLTQDIMPDSITFFIHYLLALILIPSLPFHLIAAPVITMEARRRENGLDRVMHET